MASTAAFVPEQPDVLLRDDFHRSTPWSVVFVFVIPVQEAVLQLHFHDSSPFDKHPANMWTFLFALFIYCIALSHYVKPWLTGSRSFKNICDQVGYISGSLASAALISVLVSPCFEPFVFLIWMVASALFVDVTRYWILEVALKLYHFANDAVSYLSNIWKQIIGNINNVSSATGPLLRECACNSVQLC